MSADFTTELPSDTDECVGYEAKAYPSSTVIGLHNDPRLVQLTIVDHNASRATGKGRLVLRGTKSDPLHEIPIISIGDFTYISGDTDDTVESETPMGLGDKYLPYLIGRHYDDLRVFRIGDSFDQANQLEEEAFHVRRFNLQ
ncbi:hypothetical protein BJY04DRAFT_222731 [Aspergillus karnatakaensis]|uniref:uncharacterized protein n=1 Tax=Aspergillus karnatakaensis TaxID=1810916 RepID=UPI003CCD46E0